MKSVSLFGPNLPFESIVTPLPKEYIKVASEYFHRTQRPSGSSETSSIHHKPFKNLKGKAFNRSLASGPVLSRDRTWAVEMMIVHCREHDQAEMVPLNNFHYDLIHWYWVGRHPRFSIVGALMEADQRYREIRRLSNTWRGANPDHLYEALQKADTQEQFLEIMDPHLMTDLRFRGNRYRVSRAFKRRFDKKAFTTGDFFENRNQELRRLILRMLPIEEVLKGLKFLIRDEEGALYEEEPDQRRYLHVKCPSTGQDYLLEVPDTIDHPKEARRWTFSLHPEAEFAQEG